MTLLQTFEANTAGRDLVIGDLHGNLDALLEGLAHVAFDPAVDRLFSAGDLIDRGKKSADALALLDEPWFHCVGGNHEAMAIEAMSFGNPWMWQRNGGSWAESLVQDWYAGTPAEREQGTIRFKQPGDAETCERLFRLEALPAIITLHLQDGRRCHLIHAELPLTSVFSEAVTDEALQDEAFVRRLASAPATRDHGPALSWERNLFYSLYVADLSNPRKVARTLQCTPHNPYGKEGLSLVISGHTILQRPIRWKNALNIDTGAYNDGERPWSGLTLYEPLTNRAWLATSTGCTETPILDLSDEPAEDPVHP
jgi:hypothetical protein